jgi:hypothetical protein
MTATSILAEVWKQVTSSLELCGAGYGKWNTLVWGTWNKSIKVFTCSRLRERTNATYDQTDSNGWGYAGTQFLMERISGMAAFWDRYSWAILSDQPGREQGDLVPAVSKQGKQ